MAKWSWDRISAAMGIVFVALFVVAFIVFGESPGLGDSADEVAAYFEDDRGRVITGGILFGLAVIAFFWFLGSVGTILRDAGQPRLAATAFGAGVGTAATALVLLALNEAQVIGIAANDPEAAKTISVVTWAFEVVISWPVAAFVLAVSVGALRALIFPVWFSWAGVGASVLLALGGTTWAEDGFWAADGEYTFFTIIVFLVWTLTASWLLAQRLAPAEVRPATAAT